MLVGGLYRPELFGLRFTDQLPADATGYWASKSRPAAVDTFGTYRSASAGGFPTSEYLELDFGRVRQVMGLMLDIIRLPFQITIEYDSISAEDGTHRWIPVTPEADLKFDDLILYEATSTSSFAHCEFYFSNFKGELIHTRYLRIGFNRRDVAWPLNTSLGNPYPAIVKNLRTFRSVSDHKHMAGPLFVSDPTTNSELLQLNIKPDLSTHELTQRFTFPTDATRGTATATTSDDIIPSMLGFSFLADISDQLLGSDADETSDVNILEAKWRWSLWDVTNEIELDKGLSTGAAHSGRCWIDCYFSRPLQGDLNTTYEIRLSSRFTTASSGVYLNKPISVPGFQVPSTLTGERRSRLLIVDDTEVGTGLMQVGDYIQAVDGLNSYEVVGIGTPGGYVSFNGASGRIDIDYDAALVTDNWSASFWYRRDPGSMAGVESVMIDNSDIDGNGWRISIGPDGGSLTSALQVTCAGVTLYDSINTADAEWHHAFVTMDEATGDLTLYRDGEEVDSDTGLTYTPNADTNTKICIGTKWGTDWGNLIYNEGEWSDAGVRYTGDLDDIGLYDAKVSPADVLDIYEYGHGGESSVAAVTGHGDIVAFYTANDDIGSTTLVDEIASYDGTVEPSGVSFTGAAQDELVIEINRGWREASSSRSFFIVPRLTHVSDGQRNVDYSRNLVMRMWADVGDSGRDILGNKYRYATRLLDSASRVLDPASPGWMSAPRPSPEAVESLYFDVRQQQGTGQNEHAVIDCIRVAPRTHGVRMHIYYSKDNLHGEAPKLTDHWDQMVWTPVNEVYTLRRDEVIQLPNTIKASYIKLEFTNLRPMPFAVSPFPELPPVEYKRYPTWVENLFENSKVRNAVEDWFVQNETPVQRRILKEIADPIREFEYKQRELFTALSNGVFDDPRILGSGVVDPGTLAFIDPVTNSKIKFTSNTSFRGSLLAAIRDDSLLGKAVRSRATTVEPFMREERPAPAAQRSAFVSTLGDRVTHSFSEIAETPMWFNRRCRHFYRTDKARFNRKAYYVGIRDVEFRRNDFTVEFDDTIIDDELYDDRFVELNSFLREPATSIADGQDVYVSYEIDGVKFSDERVSMDGSTLKDLAEKGVATNIEVYSSASKQGVKYNLESDYVVAFIYDVDGDVVTQIGRSDGTEFLEVDPTALQGITFRDSGVTTGIGTVPENS